jgi:hypothetical protein
MVIMHGPISAVEAERLEKEEVDLPRRKLLNQARQDQSSNRNRRHPLIEQYLKKA